LDAFFALSGGGLLILVPESVQASVADSNEHMSDRMPVVIRGHWCSALRTDHADVRQRLSEANA
jgi:hypothetical protein